MCVLPIKGGGGREGVKGFPYQITLLLFLVLLCVFSPVLAFACRLFGDGFHQFTDTDISPRTEVLDQILTVQ